MGFLIRLLAPRLGQTAAKLIAYVGIPLLIAGLIYWQITAYGSRRYKAGVLATDAKWEEAGRRMRAAAAQSATRADDAAAKRLQEFEAQVQEEQEALEDAQRNGSSPIDVLFGP